jgi:hypothetical protein
MSRSEAMLGLHGRATVSISHAWEFPFRSISHAWEMRPRRSPRSGAPPGWARFNRHEGPVQPALRRSRACEIAKHNKGGRMSGPN